jgi:RND family efflux transporter MFP subunit
MSSTDRKSSKWRWFAGAATLVALAAAYVVVYPPGWMGGPAQTVDGHASHDDHEAHEHAAEVTVWTDELEVYVNHPHAVAAEPFEIAVHITHLKTGTPLAEGAVTAELSRGGDVHEVTAAAADPGVWLIPLQLPDAGTYQTRLRVRSKDAADSERRFELPAMTVSATEEAAHEAAEAAMSENVAEVEFLKEQQWRIGLKTEVLQPREIAENLVVPGKVVAPHGSETMIVPPIPGRVLPPPSAQFPNIGARVSEGQLLAVIEPSVAGPEAVQLLVNQAQLKTLDAELAAKRLDIETKISESEVDLELANSELKRLQGLSGGAVVAEKRLIEVQHRVRQTEATLQGLRRVRTTYAEAHTRLAAFLRQVRTDDTAEADPDSLTVPLRSPLAGTVVAAQVTAGEFVSDDHPLFRVVDMQKLSLDAEVSEYDIARVQDAPGAKFRLSAYPDRVLPIFGPGAGRLVFIAGVVDPDSRTVPVRFEVPNEENLLRVGMFAEVMIETDRRGDALVVSEQAVVDDSGEAVVYVQTGGESFERRPVQLGIRDGDHLEIRRGLERGERVVTDGANAIRLSTLAGGVPEHHHHH